MNEKIRIFSLLAVLLSAVAVSGQQGAIGGNSPAHTSSPRSGAPGTLAADTFYAQPGQLVSVNGFQLNLCCR